VEYINCIKCIDEEIMNKRELPKSFFKTLTGTVSGIKRYSLAAYDLTTGTSVGFWLRGQCPFAPEAIKFLKI